ncbi:MAG: PAS domain S-box protein [Epsilonproteobacteria bacterium]|nr:PAS domain S-box protein [Campylobacterota bacterium]
MYRQIPLDVEYTFNDNLIYEIDKDGLITFANLKFCEVVGYRRSELIGKNHTVFKHPDVPQTIYDNICIESKKLRRWFFTLKNIRRDGMFFWSNIHCTPRYNDMNELIGFIIVHKPASKLDIEEENQRYKNYN